MELFLQFVTRWSKLPTVRSAHQCGRKADRMVAQEMYEEAVLCHGEAADLLKEALLMTQNEQARLSLELQIGRHLQQQRLIQETWKRVKLTRKPTVISTKKASLQPQSTPSSQPMSIKTSPQPNPSIATPQALLQGSKTVKDDRTRLEEQITTIGDLRKLVVVLLMENKKLMEENEILKLENAQLKKDPCHQNAT